MRWRIELLGGLRVRCGPRFLAPFCNRRAAALLAYLAAHPGPHGRESLAEMLWPDSDPRAARNRLRVALSALRQQLNDEELLLADRTNLALNGAICHTDAGDFQASLERARTCQSNENIPHWIAAFDLYRGALLPDFFESWIPAAEAELEASYVEAVRALMAALCQNGQAQRALEYGRHAFSLTPLREELCGDLMELHAQLGHPANALRLYRELETQLRAQLQSAPSFDLRALHERLRTTENAAIFSAIPQNISVVMPPTVAVANAMPLPSALPPQGTRFFGRVADIEILRQALVGDQTRLITLTGGGGVGKSRLAGETARALQTSWPDAVWFVPLHDVGEADLIATQIQSILGLPISERESDKNQLALEAVGLALESKPALLVLDNFEQLLPWGASVVQWLLANLPQLRLIVTSRAPLHIKGETVFAVCALSAPADLELAPDALLEYESVQLFADRARVATPSFRLTKHNAPAVAALCAQLEGWPLALELAGAQAANLRPHQMLVRLQKRLEFLQSGAPIAGYGHASLRAALEWSHELLSSGARQLFARLSVFRGSFDLEAARQIGEESDAEHYLKQLVEASLLIAEGSRFRLLETLRQFAREQLTQGQWETLQQRHAHYFLRLSQEHHAAFLGCNDERRVNSVARSRPDTDNQRAALRWSLQSEPETALALVVAMSSHWGEAFVDAAHLAERALENAPDAPPKLISTALGIAAQGAEHRGDYRRHRELALQRLELVRDLGDSWETAWAYFHLGNAAFWPGDFVVAAAAFEQSLRLFEARQDGSAVERQNLAWTLDKLGLCALEQNDLSAATRHFEASLQAFRANADRDGEASELCQLGEVWARTGELERARQLFEQAAQIERELNDARPHPWRRLSRGFLAWRQGETSLAARDFAAALRGFGDNGETIGILRALLTMGCLLVKENNYSEGAVVLSCEAEQRRARELPLPLLWRKPHRAAFDAAEIALDAPTFEATCAQGRALKLPAAIKRALAAMER